MIRTVLRFTFLAICLLAASFASADSQTWDLVGTNDSSGLPCTMIAPCASVTINASGHDATFTVTSLLNGYVFDKFGFNTIAGVSTLSLVAGGETGELGSYSLGGSGTEGGWGSFLHNFDTGLSGGSKGGDCANHGAGCTFTFEVTSTSSLSVASFEKLTSGGVGSGYFAGHMASASKSGYGGNSQLLAPLPEPPTTAVLASGLLVGIGLLGRRTLTLARQAS